MQVRGAVRWVGFRQVSADIPAFAGGTVGVGQLIERLEADAFGVAPLDLGGDAVRVGPAVLAPELRGAERAGWNGVGEHGGGIAFRHQVAGAFVPVVGAVAEQGLIEVLIAFQMGAVIAVVAEAHDGVGEHFLSRVKFQVWARELG